MHAAAWERIRHDLLRAVVESEAMPPNQVCIKCNDVLATLRCRKCGPSAFFVMCAFSLVTSTPMCFILQRSGRCVSYCRGVEFKYLMPIYIYLNKVSIFHLSWVINSPSQQMELGSRFSISADGAGFSVLHLSRWSWVLGSPSQLMELGSRFSISADGAGFSVLHLS